MVVESRGRFSGYEDRIAAAAYHEQEENFVECMATRQSLELGVGFEVWCSPMPTDRKESGPDQTCGRCRLFPATSRATGLYQILAEAPHWLSHSSE